MANLYVWMFIYLFIISYRIINHRKRGENEMTITPELTVMMFLTLIGIIGVIIVKTKKGQAWLDKILKE